MADHVQTAAALASSLQRLHAAAAEHEELALLAYLIEMALVEAKDRAKGSPKLEAVPD